jgi:hypothetical protein
MSDVRRGGEAAARARADNATMNRLLGLIVLVIAAAGACAGSAQASTTASVMLNAGALSFVNGTPASTLTFPTTTLNGANRTLTATLAFDVSDATGSGAGWNVTATSTQFTSGSKTLPAAATTIQTAPSLVCDLLPIFCTLASTVVSYPYTLPAATVAPAATPIYDAVANTGLGAQTFTTTWTLAVPAGVFASATPYTSTWTFSLGSGP